MNLWIVVYALAIVEGVDRKRRGYSMKKGKVLSLYGPRRGYGGRKCPKSVLTWFNGL